MELEIIMLHEISQLHKDKHCMFSLICGSKGETKQNTQHHESKRGTMKEVEGKEIKGRDEGEEKE
jgi:hypothetical protein